MGWQDILKSEEESLKQERDKLLEELVNNVHFFNPNIGIYPIVRRPPPRNFLKPLVRSLEFMRPIKDDIKFEASGERRIDVRYTFEVSGIECGISYRLRELGQISEDNFILIDDKHVCVKATRDMTNGDFLTTLVYAVKNNVIPDIVKFVAYSSSKGHRFRADSYVYDSSEEDYKRSFLILLYREWEESDLFDDNEEINLELINNYFNLNDVNFWLAQFEVPEDILGRW